MTAAAESPPARRVEVVHTRIWDERPEPDDAFAARSARCHGFDVYGEMLGRASWAEMVFLLLRGEPPAPAQARLFDALAVALANPGPRDPAVHAAMCGGVGGSTSASCLVAALSVGAGQLAGGREILLAMQRWQSCGRDLDAWSRDLAAAPEHVASVWPAPEHAPGFDPHARRMPTIAAQALACLAGLAGEASRLAWLAAQREALERAAGHPLSLTGVAAAAFADLGFAPEQGEMLHLMLRLPGAAAHALEQRALGHKQFPFFTIEVARDEEALAS